MIEIILITIFYGIFLLFGIIAATADCLIGRYQDGTLKCTIAFGWICWMAGLFMALLPILNIYNAHDLIFNYKWGRRD